MKTLNIKKRTNTRPNAFWTLGNVPMNGIDSIVPNIIASTAVGRRVTTLGYDLTIIFSTSEEGLFDGCILNTPICVKNEYFFTIIKFVSFREMQAGNNHWKNKYMVELI